MLAVPASHLDSWVYDGIDEIEEKNSEGKQVSIDNGSANNHWGIIQADSPKDCPTQARPQKYRFCDGCSGKQTDDYEREICDNCWQGWTQNITCFNFS